MKGKRSGQNGCQMMMMVMCACKCVCMCACGRVCVVCSCRISHAVWSHARRGDQAEVRRHGLLRLRKSLGPQISIDLRCPRNLLLQHHACVVVHDRVLANYVEAGILVLDSHVLRWVAKPLVPFHMAVEVT